MTIAPHLSLRAGWGAIRASGGCPVAFGYSCRPVLLDGVQGCLGGLQAGQGITCRGQWRP